MQIGEARIDSEALVIDSVNGRLSIEPKVMQVLQALAAKPNTVISREDLIQEVWGVSYGGDERLSRAMSLLRKALGDEHKDRKYIETISRRGYRLIADVILSDDTILQTERHSKQDSHAQEAADNQSLPLQKSAHQNVTNANIDNASNSPPTYRLSLKKERSRWLAMGAITVTAAFFVMGMTLKQEKRIPIATGITRGFENIQNFGHPNAIEDAQNLFTDILSEKPNHAAANAGLALALIREYTASESDPTLLNQAEIYARNALAADEHLALSNIAMGWIARFRNKHEEALTHFDKADLLDKDHPLTLESRFRITARQGDLSRAEEILKYAIQVHPENAVFHQNAAQLYSFIDDFTLAETHIKESIALDPNIPRAYAQLGNILHMQNRTDEAIKAIQSGLKVNETAALYNNLGTYLFFQGQYTLALSAFKKTLEFDGNTHAPLYWANLGDAYRWVPGKEDKAEKHFKRAIQLWKEQLKSAPNSLDLKTRIALYQSKIDRKNIDGELLDKILASNDLPSSHYYRSLVTAELSGQREKALNLLKKSINSGYPLNEIKNDPELRNLREDADYHLILAE